MNKLLRQILRLLFEFRARLSGRGFFCNALQGESEYNISINCDMTVSCNCQDDGSGILGSLDETSFEEIFFGAKANAFRESLAKGKLPILTCARCAELRRNVRAVALKRPNGPVETTFGLVKHVETSGGSGAFKNKPDFNGLNEQSDLRILTPRLPYRGLLVENTIACNLACPGCIRPAVAQIRKRTRLSLDDVRKVSGLIQRLGLKKLFYFNRGEPFLSPDILKEMKIIREQNPDVHIVTSTNGMFLDSDEKREAAFMMDEVLFSIDGCDQKSLEKYQRGGDFERALTNMRELVRIRDERDLTKPVIEWKYLLFNCNDRAAQIATAIRLAVGGREPVDTLLNGSCSGPGESLTTRQAINSSTDSASPSADVISFWPTSTPLHGISLRYRLGLLNKVGVQSWKGREVRLGQDDRFFVDG